MPFNIFDDSQDDDLELSASQSQPTFDIFDENSEAQLEEPAKPRGLFSTLMDFTDSLSVDKQLTEDQNELARLRQEEGGYGPVRSNLRKHLGLDEASLDMVSNTLAGGSPYESLLQIISPEYAKQRMQAESDERHQRMEELRARIEANSRRAKSLEEHLNGPLSTVSKAIGGLAGDPTQILPTAGALVGSLAGPGGAAFGSAVGSIPITNTAFASAYAEALDMGANDDEALDYANKLSAIQAATEGLGGVGEAVVAKGAAKLGLKKYTKEQLEEQLLKRITSRTGRIVGAGTVEAFENTAQELAGDAVRATTHLSDPEAQKVLAERVAQDTTTRLERVLDSGAVGFISGATIASPVAIASHAYEAGKSQQDISNAIINNYNDETKAASKVDLDIADEIKRLDQERAKEDAFKQAEADRATQEKADAQQKADEVEAGFRTIELENQFKGQTRVERAGDSIVERIPINPPAEITPEQVQAEREQAEAAERERLARVEQAKQAEAKANAAATATKPVKAKAKKAKKNAKPRATAPATLGQVTNNAEIANLAQQLGGNVDSQGRTLNMDSIPEDNGAAQEKGDFTAQVKKLVKGLVKNNSQQAVDLQNLIKQKKLVVAPNADSVGRTDKGQAAYDVGTGKMYLYTDHINTNKPAGSIIAALHESTHAGQFNDREGRSSVLRQMLGTDRYDKAQQIILQAARDGNKLARAARDKSKAAGDDRYLEIVPYFVGEAAEARQGFGRLGGLVKDIKGAGRSFLRDNLGLDLEVTLDDINTAGQTMAGEIVRTKIEPSVKDKSLNMIGGRSAEGFAAAADDGRIYIGKVDKLPRFEFSDHESTIDEDALKAIRDNAGLSSGRTTLGSILKHDELYKQYPELADYIVRVDPGIGKVSDNANGYFSASARRLALSPKTAESPVRARSVLLHEVQHAIQSLEGHVAGINAKGFESPAIKDAYNKTRDKYNDTLAKVTIAKESKTLPESDLKEFHKQLSEYSSKTPSTVASASYAKDLFYTKYASKSSDEGVVARGKDFVKVKKDFDDAAEALDADKRQAFETYLRDYGETEARTTQLRRDLPPEDRELLSPEEDMKYAAGKVPVEKTHDASALLRSTEESLSASDDGVFLLKDARDRKELKEFRAKFLKDVSDRAAVKREEAEAGGHKFSQGDEVVSKTTGRRVVLLSKVMMKDTRDIPEGLSHKERRELVDSRPLVPGWLVGGGGWKAGIKDEDQPEGAWTGNVAEWGWEKPTKLAVVPKSLSMARESMIEQEEKGFITKLFDKSKRSGTLNEIIEFAQSSPAEIRMVAIRNSRLFDTALKAEARKRGTTTAALSKKIQSELDAAVADTKGYNENYAAFKSVADKYGQAGKVLLDMRNNIDRLTMNIIQQRLGAGALSDGEKKLYSTLLNNLGRYTHRQYAAMIGGKENDYSERVWSDYAKVKKNGGKGETAAVANYKKVANAIDYLITKGIAIPEDAGLAKLSAEHTQRLYDVWQPAGPSRELTTEQKKAALSTMRNQLTPERLNRTAEALAEELLGLGTRDSAKEIVSYYRGNKQNLSILKQREHVPAPIRELLGEIKDPAMRMMVTASKQAEFVARNRMLLEIASKVGPDVQPPNAIGTEAAEGLERVKGEGWGVLDGYFLSKDLRDRLGDSILTLGTLEDAVALVGVNPSAATKIATWSLVDKWGHVAGFQKRMAITLKPANYLFNYVGAYAQMLNNGNLSIKHWAKAHKAAGQLIAAAVDPQHAGELAIEANKYGITDSAFVGELKTDQHKTLLNIVNQMAGMPPSKAATFLRASGRTTAEVYAMMDVWSKIANFYNETEMLTKYYKAIGQAKTEEEIKRQAADRTNATNITYKRASALTRAAERIGLTNFANYFYEVYRSQLNNAMLGISDLTEAMKAPTPKGKAILAAHGAKRLSGQVLVWAGMNSLTKTLAHTFGDDDDDEDKRYLLPDFIRNQDFLPVGFDKNGHMVVWDLSRVDPIGPITDLMRAVNQPDADFSDIIQQFKDLYVAPRIGAKLLRAFYGTAIDQSTKSSTKLLTETFAPDVWDVANTLAPGDERVHRLWVDAVETLVPGWASGFKPSNPVPETKEPWQVVPASLRFLGTSFYTVDPDKSTKFATYDYKDAVDLARRDAKDALKNHPDGLTQSELANLIGGAQDRQRDAFENLYNVTKGLRAIGKTDREITLMLKNAGLPRAAILAVKSGEFKDTAITRKSLVETMRNEMKAAPQSERKAIRDKWMNAMMLLQEPEGEDSD